MLASKEYVCKRCHYKTNKTSSYVRHIERQLDCEPVSDDAPSLQAIRDEYKASLKTEYTCEYCGKHFASIQSKSRHVNHLCAKRNEACNDVLTIVQSIIQEATEEPQELPSNDDIIIVQKPVITDDQVGHPVITTSQVSLAQVPSPAPTIETTYRNITEYVSTRAVHAIPKKLPEDFIERAKYLACMDGSPSLKKDMFDYIPIANFPSTLACIDIMKDEKHHSKIIDFWKNVDYVSAFKYVYMNPELPQLQCIKFNSEFGRLEYVDGGMWHLGDASHDLLDDIMDRIRLIMRDCMKYIKDMKPEYQDVFASCDEKHNLILDATPCLNMKRATAQAIKFYHSKVTDIKKHLKMPVKTY